MLSKLFILFITVPLIELYTLITIGKTIGAFNTFALVIGTGALGAYLAKREGFAVWAKIQTELKEGNLPKNELIDGVLLFVAGVVLITPGVFTDIFGLILLTPQGRAIVRGYLSKHFKGGVSIQTAGSQPFSQQKQSHQKKSVSSAAFTDYEIVEE